MKVGDIVKHFLTEQIGSVMAMDDDAIHVLWTTQGLSLFAPGNKEWGGEKNLELLTSS